MTEWKSQTLRAYQRRTLAADALIASTYLAGTNTRRVRRALAALFGGTVGKDTVSRTWRKVKNDWDAWHTRSLTGDPIVRLILDGHPPQSRSHGCGRSSINSTPHDKSPDDTRHLVSERDNHKHSRLLGEHAREPRASWGATADCLADHAAGSNNQNPAKRPFAHLRHLAETLFATGSALQWRQA